VQLKKSSNTVTSIHIVHDTDTVSQLYLPRVTPLIRMIPSVWFWSFMSSSKEERCVESSISTGRRWSVILVDKFENPGMYLSKTTFHRRNRSRWRWRLTIVRWSCDLCQFDKARRVLAPSVIARYCDMVPSPLACRETSHTCSHWCGDACTENRWGRVEFLGPGSIRWEASIWHLV
jgi:hypothetical protein